MSATPQGWYPDPTPPPGGPPNLRWWNGFRWTEHTHPAPPDGFTGVVKMTTTPDGQPLAGWWARVGATLIDGVIIVVIGVAVAFPLYRHLFHEFSKYMDDVMDASRNGTTPPSSLDFQTHMIGTSVAIGAIALVINLLYSAGFLKWKQATPGKLVVGLRVRLRERPGPLSWRTVGLHWAGQYGPSVLNLIPLVGGFAGLYTLLDSLWPLWDNNRQALHDKLAGTNVVVHRR